MQVADFQRAGDQAVKADREFFVAAPPRPTRVLAALQ
jgi:hypothetical protein